MIEMDWTCWIGKKVFLRTKHDKVYSGLVKEIDLDHLPIVWIVLKDKFGMIVQFSAEEIVEIKEEM